ncbi:hypothetical protein [Halorussus amylolyticus]|uniref:hypothetical protein n=1 Tax=Halorussus amylolyticus TaxID=1126242 RepID=UPI001051683F|nr:hypothetical protein [Halorussus amylolyticus]
MNNDRERDDHGQYADRKDPFTIIEIIAGRSDPYAPLTATEVAESLGWARRTALNKLTELHDRHILSTKKVGGRARVWWLHPGVRVPYTQLQYSDAVTQQDLLDGAWAITDISEGYDTKRSFWQTALEPTVTRLGAFSVDGGRRWTLTRE